MKVRLVSSLTGLKFACCQPIVSKWVICSVTRFGENSPLWQKNQTYLGKFLDGLFYIWKTFLPTLAFLCLVAIVIVVYGHKLNNNIVVWSHWSNGYCSLDYRTFFSPFCLNVLHERLTLKGLLNWAFKNFYGLKTLDLREKNKLAMVMLMPANLNIAGSLNSSYLYCTLVGVDEPLIFQPMRIWYLSLRINASIPIYKFAYTYLWSFSRFGVYFSIPENVPNCASR